MLVGYKRMTIMELDENLIPITGTKTVIEGTANEGATSSFEITGLSKEAVKTHGSDKVYHISQKGTGDVKANFGILDLPYETEQKILGRKKNADGVYHIGENTEPPYYAVLLESKDLKSNIVGFGLYAGKFARDAVTSSTLTDEDFKPEADDFTFVAVSKNIDGTNETVGVANGDTAFTALGTELFGA